MIALVHTTEREVMSQAHNHWAAAHRHWPRWFRMLRLQWYRWRTVIHSNAHVWFAYRVMVAVVGGAIVVAGLALVPLPGPGWLIVFIGLAILATEFHWANRLLRRGGVLLRIWRDWLMRQHMAVRILLGAATCLFVCAIVYGILLLTGLPSWTPTWAAPPWLGIPVNVA
ncbi:hypothetical protein GCM10027344_15130 [Spelaeicoccus albus]